MNHDCNSNTKIEFNTSYLRSNLCDYGDAYIFVEETIEVS